MRGCRIPSNDLAHELATLLLNHGVVGCECGEPNAYQYGTRERNLQVQVRESSGVEKVRQHRNLSIRVRKAIGTPVHVGRRLPVRLDVNVKVLMGFVRGHPDNESGKQIPLLPGLEDVPNMLPATGKHRLGTNGRGRPAPKRVENAFAIGDDVRNVVKELEGNKQGPELCSGRRINPVGRDPAAEAAKLPIRPNYDNS